MKKLIIVSFIFLVSIRLYSQISTDFPVQNLGQSNPHVTVPFAREFTVGILNTGDYQKFNQKISGVKMRPPGNVPSYINFGVGVDNTNNNVITVDIRKIDLQSHLTTNTLPASNFGALIGDVNNPPGKYATKVVGIQNVAIAAAKPNKGDVLLYDGTSWTPTRIGQTASWSLIGNSGTDSTKNFIGTTDDVPLRFRVNGKWAGQIQSNTHDCANTSFGYFAGSSIKSTVILSPVGHEIIQGIENTAFGSTALISTSTGNANTAIGSASLSDNRIGSANTSIGQNSMIYYANGNSNTAIGTASLYGSNQISKSGDNNVAVGESSLYSTETGSDNVSIGTHSMFNNKTGSKNIAIGSEALRFKLLGPDNIMPGSNNVIIGYRASESADNIDNAIAIGSEAIVDASNKVVIGNNKVTVIGGFANWSNFSDERFKMNIKENVPGIEFIKRLNTVTYQLDIDKFNEYSSTGKINNSNIHKAALSSAEQIVHTGFLAQQVESICKEMGYDFDGVVKPSSENGHYSLSYSQFVVPMVKAIQEQQIIIESQKEENRLLKEKMIEILKRIDNLERKSK